VNQLSRPYQVALAAVALLAVAWMLVLKPKDDVVESAATPAPAAASAAAPGVTGLDSAVSKAQGAVAASQGSADATTAATEAVGAPASSVPAATGAAATAAETPTGTASSAATTAKAPSGDPSAPILASLAKGDVAVLLFYERAGSDDRAVRRAVRELPRHHGRVRVFSAPIADVGRYEAITRGVSVLAAPTVLVIGSDRQAHAITGFTDVDEIDQLVGDALKRTRSVSAGEAPASPDAA